MLLKGASVKSFVRSNWEGIQKREKLAEEVMNNKQIKRKKEGAHFRCVLFFMPLKRVTSWTKINLLVNE